MAQEPEKTQNQDSSEESSSDEKRKPTRIARQPAVRRPQSRRGRYHPRRKVCFFCENKEKHPDWKDLDTLRRFVGDNGQIFPRRKTGACAKHQRHVAVAVKRARHIALLPYTSEHVRIMGKS